MQQKMLKRVFRKNPPVLRAIDALDGFLFLQNRQDAGLSREEVAQELGITVSDVEAIESGQQPFPAWTYPLLQRVVKYQQNHRIGNARPSDQL